MATDFPRAGAWCVALNGAGEKALGILAKLGHQRVQLVPHIIDGVQQFEADGTTPATVKRDFIDEAAPFAEVHFVETASGAKHGETIEELKNVPFSDIRQASAEEVMSMDRNAHVTPEQAAANGYLPTGATPAHKAPVHKAKKPSK